MCFYRRSEVPASLVHLADKHHWAEVDVEPVFLFYLLFLVLVIQKGDPLSTGIKCRILIIFLHVELFCILNVLFS